MDLVASGTEDEALLLDLLNTSPVVDGVPRDDLEHKAAARAWMRARGIRATDAERAALVEARSILQAVVRGTQPATALQPFLHAVSCQPSATGTGLDWQLRVDREIKGAVRAVLAWDALRILGPGRLRPCANTECQLFLIDRSRPNTARWCSMAICGNRMKARRHYQRSRSTANREKGANRDE
jgi:predicted RNA-binding Zn ribbon-like protein